MSDPTKAMRRRLNRHTIGLVLVACCIVAVAGVSLLHRVHEDIAALQLSWMGDRLKVYSSKDGPFVVTHLFQPWSGSRESSVALLPEPVTIIDSRGHQFSHADIQSLTWVGTSGKTAPPPLVGTDLKAFYWVPQETDRISDHDIFRNRELR